MPTKVIFIASLSHSSSTLLDLMLNAHPQVISGGELKQLQRFALFKKEPLPHVCTCGAASLWECPFWSRVNNFTKTDSGQSIGDLNVEDYSEFVSFQADNALLFKALSAVSGKEYIVDSSKAVRRLELLLGSEALQVFPIFLLRDPRGQIWSAMKKGESDLERLIQDYVAKNREIYELICERPHAIVRYERLVKHPQKTLSALMPKLGLEFHPVQLNWGTQERHNVGGNMMRFKQENTLKLDEAWREKLSLLQSMQIRGLTLSIQLLLLKAALRKTVGTRSSATSNEATIASQANI